MITITFLLILLESYQYNYYLIKTLISWHILINVFPFSFIYSLSSSKEESLIVNISMSKLNSQYRLFQSLQFLYECLNQQILLFPLHLNACSLIYLQYELLYQLNINLINQNQQQIFYFKFLTKLKDLIRCFEVLYLYEQIHMYAYLTVY